MTAPAPGSRWRELDLLRGVAAACMVLNHVAVKSPGWSTSRAIGWSEFVGGFAPVLFYLATGLGYGVRSAPRAGRRSGFLLKVAVLLVADSDFFVFIGLSMLLLEFVGRSPRSELVASAIALASVAARFVVAPLARTTLGWDSWEPYLANVLGTGGHFGYPVGPWLAYPMLGYLLGKLAANHRERLDRWRSLPLAVFAAGIPFGSASLAMVWRGSGLIRYESMNAAYFLASLFVVAASLSLVMAVTRAGWLSPVAKLVSLEGLRSFAVVPIHYTLLEIAAFALGAPNDAGSFGRNLAIVLASSFLLSWPFVRFARALDRPGFRGPTIVLVAMFAVAYHAVPRGPAEDFSTTALRSALQLSLCVMLAFREVHRPPLREGRKSSP